MKNLGRNLQLGFVLSLILLVISSAASYFAISNLLQSADLVDHSAKVVEKLEGIVSTMKDAETGQRGYLLTGRKEFLEPYTGSYERSLELTNEVKDLTSDNPKQQANIAAVKDILLHRLNIQKQMIDRKDAGGIVSVDDLRTGKASMDALRKFIKIAERDEKSLLEDRTGSLKRSASLTPLIILFAGLLAVGFSIFSLIRVSWDMRERARLLAALEAKDLEMTKRIGIIQHIAGQISAGDYSTRVDDHEKDDLGGLSLSLNKMAESLEESFHKISNNEWMQTGISRLNDLMIGEKDLPALTRDILEFIAGYTDSQVGALYLLEQEKLRLKSGYALMDAKPNINLGEGLLGQAALDGKPVWLKELDENYMTVSHASGCLRPKSLLIIPVYHENRVTGVIELGSVKAYPDRKLDFLKSVSPNIGIAVNSAENRKKMQELLEETQAQSEELQVQHNELENMNTELEAHTQKLQTSEEELRVQQEELQQSNQELAERNRQVQERNAEIQQTAAELEQSTRYKSEFMANMSHELRTPLNSILLLSRYLSENSENNLSAEQIESAGVILNSGNGLLNLIDELLDLSKIEAGKMELEYQQQPVGGIISDLRSLFQPVAKEKTLELIFQNNLSADFILDTDRMRLEQILKNLLSNALKFTAEGSVQLTVLQADNDPGILEWQVNDTGIGIPLDKQHLVFDAFQQADGSTKRKFGGTGLGLSISRELARLLGGDISLQSEPGKGSTFTLRIPVSRERVLTPELTAVVATLSAAPIVQGAAGKYVVPVIPVDVDDDRHTISTEDRSILIIEDDTAFAKALLGFTRKNGYKGIVAVRGDQAVLLAEQFKPVAILLDIQLPVKDGWQVMEELKTNKETRHIPVHMMSSLEAKRESRMKGAVDFINKPIAVEQMKQMFRKLEDVWSRNPKKVLIIEENAKHAQALAFFLETFNVTSAVAESIQESVEALKNKEVDCVIMDMGIPGGQAYETLEMIKQNPGMEDLPIIVFTGKHLSSGEEGRIRKYADTIVMKTAHSYQRILDEVTLFLHLVEEQKPGKDEPVKINASLQDVLNGKTVLIADDDVRNIYSMTRSLEKYGMNVLSASDGKEALEQLELHPETAIVLMDMMMPEMDGYESTARIRQHPAYKDLPVIAVTAKAMLGDREKCIAAGASDYISKPVDVDQLVSLLRVWLFNK
ncbi:response regulator [Mucilaginibacter sp. CAU 1740]|uniref:response regulator n=1 Tax=Mucilaginibacter sp. CAU 1740 TaxID=3140365 RepID=UPI00325C29E2